MKALRLQGVWILASLMGASLCAGADPFVGVWKLDRDRSKFVTGEPSYMFATMQIESIANGLKSTASGASGEGFANDLTFSCSLDGTPCKVVSTTPLRGANTADTISLKRIDDRTITATGTLDGKLVYTDRRAISADGGTMTVSRNGTTPAGKKYESTIVLTRTH